MFSQEFITQQEEKLNKELAEVERKLGAISKATPTGAYRPDFPDYGSSSDDAALEVEQYAQNLAIDQNLLTIREKIQKALKKIAQGTYGVCEGGGTQHPIEAARLEAFPEAATCIEHTRR